MAFLRNRKDGSVKDALPLGDLIFEMCARLDLDPRLVQRLDIYPDHLEAEVHLTKHSLSKEHPRRVRYRDPATQDAAVKVVAFDITTAP
jgi:hypothetical protein